jgi:replicative DNA helicase
VAGVLSLLKPPATVRILQLPDLPPKGDIVDYIDGKECLDADDLRHGIEELADAVPVWRPSEPPTDSAPDDPGPDWYTIADIQALPQYDHGLPPISTGFVALDEALRGGLRPECVYVVAGRTGTSKSTLVLNIARKAALDGHTVLVFKLEESPREAVWRLHAAASQVRLNRLLDGVAHADDEDRRKLADGGELIRGLPIRLSENRHLQHIQRISRTHVEAGGKVIIVDQLSMAIVPDTENLYHKATTVSNVLRLLAAELHVPVIVVCQINRLASRNKTYLSVNDLRDSGAIENDAAGVILIDNVRTPDGVQWSARELTRYLDIIIAKNRYGPTTDPKKPLTLVWWPALCRIEDVAHVPVEGER